MLLCYIDESGTPEIPGTSSHYVLAGVSIPVEKWQEAEKDVQNIKKTYGLEDKEIHTAWILRNYLEQSRISDFDTLSRAKRIYEVEKLRKAELFRLQKLGGKSYKQVKKNYKFTSDYIHLSRAERNQLIVDLAAMVSSWNYAYLFAECIDKIAYDPARSSNTIDEQALEQITTRLEFRLKNYSKVTGSFQYGMLIHDNNQTVAKKHTALFHNFHKAGTFWTSIPHIVETPLFVDSSLTNMVQIADLCAYAIRRYLENNETQLFDLVFTRADVRNGRKVGVRHFPGSQCNCKICQSHK